MAARDNPTIDMDVIESGRPDTPPGRPAAGWILVLVVAAAAVGYWAGDRHGASATPAIQPLPSATPVVDQLIAGTGKRCSSQVKKQLQLGVEVVNRSATTVSLSELQAILPLKGLRAKAETWGGCGQLPDAGSGGNYLLAAAGTTWLTITFDVLVPCPAPLPVLFTLQYAQGTRTDVVDLPSFNDLGDVPYAGAKC